MKELNALQVEEVNGGGFWSNVVEFFFGDDDQKDQDDNSDSNDDDGLANTAKDALRSRGDVIDDAIGG